MLFDHNLMWIKSIIQHLFVFSMLILVFCMIGCVGRQSSSTQVTFAIINARVWTGNFDQPWAEAIAISKNIIAAVGTDAEIKALISNNTRVIDAGGQMVTPGFIDSHLHFIEGGFRLTSVQLREARTKTEFIARIKEYASTIDPGVWITGGDWDHESWGGELPNRDWIDPVTPNNPVWINRLDGHMALANSVALMAANVTTNTPDIDGGTIIRSQNGQPTGILKDNAMILIDRVIPEPPAKMKRRALEAAMAYVAEQGVTSVHHMGTWDDLAIFEQARDAGKLRTRIYAAVPLSSWHTLASKVAADGTGDRWLQIGGLKGFVDGSLGSRTAAFFEPFVDTPGDSGLLVNSEEALYQWISSGDSAGLQIIVHAIGDRAIHLQLNIYEQVARENAPRDRRFRIEHAQHIAPTDIARFKAIGVIASMQPYHAIDDGRWAEKVIGPERIKTTYAFRSLLNDGARVAFGSDWYVAPPTPLEGIYAAATRRTLDGKNPDGWVPEQKISVDEALRCYTSNAAYASFEEKLKGTLAPGKLADLVIIDRDLTRIPSEEIRNARVMVTMVDGKVVFQR